MIISKNVRRVYLEVEEEGELDEGLRDIGKLFDDSEKILKEKNAAKN